MTETILPTVSAKHLEAVSRATTNDTFVAPTDESIRISNFTFTSAMLPGWIFARPRTVDTERGVRLIQVNVQAVGSESLARIEVLETVDPDQIRPLFLETLTRFQKDPATILCNPPKIGEAEACIGDAAIVFLRGNLVVTITTIGVTPAPVQKLARHLDEFICEKPANVEDVGTTNMADARPMVKVFVRNTRSGRETNESFAIGADGIARRLPQSDN